ncbi:hypothetical protein ACMFMF_000855 [Clarireedia jacksonii]
MLLHLPTSAISFLLPLSVFCALASSLTIPHPDSDFPSSSSSSQPHLSAGKSCIQENAPCALAPCCKDLVCRGDKHGFYYCASSSPGLGRGGVHDEQGGEKKQKVLIAGDGRGREGLGENGMRMGMGMPPRVDDITELGTGGDWGDEDEDEKSMVERWWESRKGVADLSGERRWR